MNIEDVIIGRRWDDEPNKSYGAAAIAKRIQERLEKRLPSDRELSLTALQELALSDSRFWRSEGDFPNNLVIQGATSAGKTLLSELAIIDVLCQHGKAVVLVPLRAMVHERTEQFQHDIGESGFGYEVYGSSGDYLDNDERLINGEYSVCVIVYEKFFAMLSQSSCRLLDDCGLIVVDELSMLGKDERGPKLEMALEIARARNPKTRIMCLATSDCDTKVVANWLLDKRNADYDPVIKCPLRPVGLKEHIVTLSGEYQCRYIPSETETKRQEERTEGVQGSQGKLEIPGYNPRADTREKKRRLLITVLKRIYDERPDSKVLVFVANRAGTSYFAEYIKRELDDVFMRTDSIDDLLKEADACDRDEDWNALINNLIPHGIAYHHAGISANLRELIEEAFQTGSAGIKLIVATETLTVGVNMPFDAMIVMDDRVPHGSGPEQLTNQEYRNYIGRAGRLGQSNRPGESWLFVTDASSLRRYWSGYYECTEGVESALKGASEVEKAPYYLGLMAAGGNTVFEKKDLKRLHKRSLAYACGDNAFKPKKMMGALRDSRIIGAIEMDGLTDEAGKEKTERFSLYELGKALAPYALSMDTALRIQRYFTGGKDRGLPKGTKGDDIRSDVYLLEILYHVCRHRELEQSTNLLFPKDVQKSAQRVFTARTIVKDRLRGLLEETDNDGLPKNQLWSNDGELAELASGNSMPNEAVMLQAAMRAILLLHWTNGRTLDEIKKSTGFDKFLRFSVGDIERFAEVVAFHLDAIQHAIAIAEEGVCGDAGTIPAFYDLQSRVKYGMPRSLVGLANKHVHGLDRSRLLAFGERAKSEGWTPQQCLYMLPSDEMAQYISIGKCSELMERLEKRTISRFGAQLDMLTNDGVLSEEQGSELGLLNDWDGEDPGDFLGHFERVLDHNKAFRKFDLLRPCRGADGLMKWRYDNDGVTAWYLIAVASRTTDADLLLRQVADATESQGNEGGFVAKVMLYKDENGIEELIDKALGKFDIALTTDFFALRLGGAMQLDEDGASALAKFLADGRGVFTFDDNTRFSLRNYLPMKKCGIGKEPQFRLLCSRGSLPASIKINRLEEALSTEGLDYEILPWGMGFPEIVPTRMGEVLDYPTIVLADWTQVSRSRTLTGALSLVRNKSALVICGDDESARNWGIGGGGKNELKPLNDCYKMKRATAKDVVEAVDAIKAHMATCNHEGFLIGVSYASYDPEGLRRQPDEVVESQKSDVDQMRPLIDGLKEEFGEDRVLFNKYPTSMPVFAGDGGKGRSLEAYGQCSIFIVLWNDWLLSSPQCRKELEVIDDKVRRGEAACIYLRPSPLHEYCQEPIPDGAFSTSTECKNLTEIVKGRLLDLRGKSS